MSFGAGLCPPGSNLGLASDATLGGRVSVAGVSSSIVLVKVSLGSSTASTLASSGLFSAGFFTAAVGVRVVSMGALPVTSVGGAAFVVIFGSGGSIGLSDFTLAGMDTSGGSASFFSTLDLSVLAVRAELTVVLGTWPTGSWSSQLKSQSGKSDLLSVAFSWTFFYPVISECPPPLESWEHPPHQGVCGHRPHHLVHQSCQY